MGERVTVFLNIKAALAYVKELDPDRMVSLESHHIADDGVKMIVHIAKELRE
jgi:hypothetical protein